MSTTKKVKTKAEGQQKGHKADGCWKANETSIGEEVDMLTELAELQVLLVQKTGEYQAADNSAVKHIKEHVGFTSRAFQDKASVMKRKFKVAVDDSKAQDLYRLKPHEFNPLCPTASSFETQKDSLDTALQVLKSCGTTPVNVDANGKNTVAIFDAEGFRIWTKMIQDVEAELSKLRHKKELIQKTAEQRDAQAR